MLAITGLFFQIFQLNLHHYVGFTCIKAYQASKHGLIREIYHNCTKTCGNQRFFFSYFVKFSSKISGHIVRSGHDIYINFISAKSKMNSALQLRIVFV